MPRPSARSWTRSCVADLGAFASHRYDSVKTYEVDLN